jgi:putative Mg2+ transporter-C (MgtC) family protein
MDDLFPMLLSAVLGTLVGLQRQMAHKPAGLRTHTLVCIGSTMFLLVAPHAIRSFGMASFDPTRIVHGVVAGVGFLGAGAIMRTEQQVHGLTTAASIWIVAAIGVAVGTRAYGLAAVGTLLALLVLIGYQKIEKALHLTGDG